MVKESEFFQTRDNKGIWQRYCGFLDLSVREFMNIQESLLLEQMELISGSPLGRRIMGDKKPKSVQEFRESVPLTRYEDYAPYIGNCQEEELAQKPVCWARTSGKGGTPKWIPYTRRFLNWVGRTGIGMLILASASRKGEVRIGRGTRLMQNLPPEPYMSGIGTQALVDRMDLKLIPPLENAKTESFEERIRSGFAMALRTGVDVLGSLTSVLVKMGERFTEGDGQIKFSMRLMHPAVAMRLLRAYIRSRREKRSLLPKDIWPLKGLICYGMDTNIYREQLIRYWGKQPLEIYGGTEASSIATCAWNKKWMTFIPYFCFLEFIPEEEMTKNREDESYVPSTVLLDGLEEGRRYEVVISHFYGMPLLRYRVGDLIRVVALKDEETGIQTPQIAFEMRIDDVIDIAGFTRLDEKTVWQAIYNSGIKNADWAVRKETEDEAPVIRLYIELTEDISAEECEKKIHRELVNIDDDYRNLEEILGIHPLRVHLIPTGGFQLYYDVKKEEGTDLAHLKPAHINAPDSVIDKLLELSATLV